MKMNREVMHNKAQRQWVNLYNILSNKLGAEVVLTPPGIGMVDMVFSANAALVKDNNAVVANFSSPARQGETEHYKNILDDLGYETIVPKFKFEGQGDALFSHVVIIWIDRYELLKIGDQEVGDFLNVKNVNSMMLNQDLPLVDTCFCPLDGGHVIFYPVFNKNDVTLIQINLEK